MKIIGLFFGSFDPPHIGHINIASSVLNAQLVDEVQMVVAYSNPWKKKQTPFDDRVKMTKMACTSAPNIEVNCIEKMVYNNVKSTYTYQVLEYLENVRKHAKKGVEYVIITTQETYKEMPQWKQGEWIMKNFKFIVITCEHFGNNDFQIAEKDEIINIKDINICSTSVRNMAKAKQILIPYVTPDVANYIKEKQLYIQ